MLSVPAPSISVLGVPVPHRMVTVSLASQCQQQQQSCTLPCCFCCDESLPIRDRLTFNVFFCSVPAYTITNKGTTTYRFHSESWTGGNNGMRQGRARLRDPQPRHSIRLRYPAAGVRCEEHALTQSCSMLLQPTGIEERYGDATHTLLSISWLSCWLPLVSNTLRVR
ncbi:hypothetical protein B0T09DRAFT_95300 [Sordaria sp. MPI-SDFR-AT-0083]|nr:hypothetical protein B0T09DRAFT_95300 [Sordaria sp. MPI-SDFR-AT-0083]